MEKKKLIVGAFLSFILITSVLGFVLTFNDNATEPIINNDFIEVNNVKIEKAQQQGLWVVNNNGIQISFNNLPENLNNIKIPEFSFQTDKVYIIFEPDQFDNNLNYLLIKATQGLNSANYKTVFACTKEENCNLDVPVKDCNSYALYINRKNDSKIYIKDNCLILEGQDSDLDRYVDKINYKLIGVE